jgi:LysR family transcriptional regulator, regulator for bpeEF and oprC
MDRFAELTAFAAVVDAGGFSAAARETGQSRSAVNRLVLALEDRLGVQLLHRTTRSVSTTSAGLAFYEKARRVLEDLGELEESARPARGEPAGRVRVSLPPPTGRLDFAELVVSFMERYPKVTVEAFFETRLVDPIAEGFDVLVRSAPAHGEGGSVEHRVFEFAYILCASRAYLDGRGRPRAPDALREHCILHYGSSAVRPTWPLVGAEGALAVPVAPVLATNNLETILRAVRAGLGIAIVPAHDVDEEIADGRLVRVLAHYAVPPSMLQVIYTPGRYRSASVRLFGDFVAERCRHLGVEAGGDRREDGARRSGRA